MNATTAYLSGLITTVPVLLVQVWMARDALRRWPRLRWLIFLLLAIPFAMSILSIPVFEGRVRLPAWFHIFLSIWLYTSTPGYVCIKAFDFLQRRLFRPPETNMRRRELIRAAALATAATPLAVTLYGAFVERTAFGVREINIPLPHLPPELEGLRILQISDIHRSAFLSRRDLERVVDASRELKFDLVLHTGDFITAKGDPLEECIDAVSRLRAPAGAFGCLGNHEIYADAEAHATAYALKKGIRILRSESRVVEWNGARLNLVGVDYQRFAHRDHYLAGTKSLVVPGAVNLLMSHNPDVFPTAARLGFDLTLAGHTHGGQMRMEFLDCDLNPARFYTPFVAGMYEANGRRCYVTRGIGSISLPARVGAPPEITLLRLMRA